MERRQLLRFLGSNALVTAIAPVVNRDYPGATDPENWGEISPDFQQCATGNRQSPIDLHSFTATEPALLTIDYRLTPLTLTNTGRTIRVHPRVENSIAFRGEIFRLPTLSRLTPDRSGRPAITRSFTPRGRGQEAGGKR